jgi:hypothetical protein
VRLSGCGAVDFLFEEIDSGEGGGRALRFAGRRACRDGAQQCCAPTMANRGQEPV